MQRSNAIARSSLENPYEVRRTISCRAGILGIDLGNWGEKGATDQATFQSGQANRFSHIDDVDDRDARTSCPRSRAVVQAPVH